MTQAELDLDDPLAGPYAGESGTVLRTLMFMIPVLSLTLMETQTELLWRGRSASSPAMPVAGRDLRSTYRMKYLNNYIRGECLVLQPKGPRWIDNPSFWLFGKNERSAVLPHLNSKAETGPNRGDCYGVRWISADFANGSGAIVNDSFFGGAASRPSRPAHISRS